MDDYVCKISSFFPRKENCVLRRLDLRVKRFDYLLTPVPSKKALVWVQHYILRFRYRGPGMLRTAHDVCRGSAISFVGMRCYRFPRAVLLRNAAWLLSTTAQGVKARRFAPDSA